MERNGLHHQRARKFDRDESDSAKTLINKVVFDNGIDPTDCDVCLPVEKRDTAVVLKKNGAFIARCLSNGVHV